MVITPHYDLDIDTTLGGNNASDYIIPSQKAIKSYVDNNTGSTVDQTFNGTSTNAQSGVAIEGAGFLQNTATGTNSLTILGTASSYINSINIGANSSVIQDSTAIGYNASGVGYYATAIGYNASGGNYSTAIGYNARVTSNNSAIQIGYGENSTANTLNIGFYNGSSTHYNWQLLNGTTGLIPDARISSNIARTSDIPDVSNFVTNLSLTTTLDDYATKQWTQTNAADTTLSNVSSIDSSSAVATALDGKVNNDDYYYKSGDTTTIGGSYGGYVTTSGTEVIFTITLPKSLANITSVDCTALVTSFRKSNGGYAPSASWNAKANAQSISIARVSDFSLQFLVKYGSYGFTNNTPVGVAINSLSLSFT